jgi:putative chitinase
MRIDRTLFFQGYRGKFGRLTQKQADALEVFLAAVEKYGAKLSVRELAYIFATTHHETAKTFLPLEEYGKGKGRKYGKPVNGKKYYGRGYVQLTWDYNYEKATIELKKQFPSILKEVETKTGKKFDLVAFPELAMDVDVAAAVLITGSVQGWFTGKKLSDYINANQTDFINARRIINGTDHAKMIATTAQKYKELLSPAVSYPPPAETPIITAAQPKTEVSTFTKVGTAVTGLTGLGINLGTVIETQINRLTPVQVLYLCLSLALVGLAVWWYRQSANNAHKERLNAGESKP